MKAKLKQLWLDLISYFFPRYELSVSYNNTWGDKDDQTFIVKHFYKKNAKHLKFRTHDGDLVEVQGTEGLNYTIKQL